MGRYTIRRNSGDSGRFDGGQFEGGRIDEGQIEEGPFDEEQLQRLVNQGKLSIKSDVYLADSGLAMSLADIVKAPIPGHSYVDDELEQDLVETAPRAPQKAHGRKGKFSRGRSRTGARRARGRSVPRRRGRTRDDSEEEFSSRFARKKSSAGKIVLIVLGVAVVLVAGFFIWLHLSISSGLADYVTDLNARIPIQIEGSPLELRGASSVGKKVWLRFRVSGIRAGDSEWSGSNVAAEMRSSIDSSREFRGLLLLGVEIVLEYRDINGDLIGEIKVDRSSI